MSDDVAGASLAPQLDKAEVLTLDDDPEQYDEEEEDQEEQDIPDQEENPQSEEHR